jgi:hypothetical protein
MHAGCLPSVLLGSAYSRVGIFSLRRVRLEAALNCITAHLHDSSRHRVGRNYSNRSTCQYLLPRAFHRA